MMTTTKLVPSCDIDAMLAERSAALAALEQARVALAQVPLVHGSATLELTARGRRQPIRLAGPNTSTHPKDVAKDVAAAARMFDAELWDRCMVRSGMWAFLDRQARNEWRGKLDALEHLPFTADNVERVFLAIHRDRPAILARGIRNSFDALSIDHRTNSRSRFTETIISNYAVSGGWLTLPARDSLDDLNRWLHILRGMPEPCSDESAHRVLGGMSSIEWGTWLNFGAFLRVRFYKGAGTMHVRFVHDADRQRLNKALSHATGGRQVSGARGGWFASRDVRRD